MLPRRSSTTVALLAFAAASGVLVGAGQQGVGTSPSQFPLSQVGYFNRNTKQELDIPIGPANRIEPGGPTIRLERVAAVSSAVGRMRTYE